jgi:hypothetical protein
VKLPPRRNGRAPLAIAAFIAIPLFFASLMSSTLALEKPLVHEWRDGDRLLRTFHDPTAATTAKVWLWALLPPAVLIVIGWVATRLPYGFYVSCVSAIAIVMGVVHKTATWEKHHTQRFLHGVDLIPTSNTSNTFDPGQWEQNARDTALSLEHWTIGLAIICILAVLGLEVRRRYFARRKAPAFVPIESIHAPDVTPPALD